MVGGVGEMVDARILEIDSEGGGMVIYVFDD